MAMIGLKKFEMIPEGTYPMKVVEVKHKEAFNKVEMVLQNAAGVQYTERFDLNVDGGAWAFSIAARNLLNDDSLDAIDPMDRVGHYAEFEVEHETVEYKGRNTVFARAKSVGPASGFGEDEAPAPKKAKGMNLDDLLG